MPPRIGVFGGTFDPPHVGHLAIAERAREQLGLDRVLFVPAGRPPHKRDRRLSSAAARVAMTRLAVRGNRAFRVSTLETGRRGPSFTVETLRRLRAAHPRAEFFLIVGEDSLRDFATWREPRAIAELAVLAVARRAGARRGPGHRPRRPRGARPSVVWLDLPRLAVSSSELRARAREGRSLRYLVPDAVIAFAARRRLYGGGR